MATNEEKTMTNEEPSLNDQETVRREKAERLRAMGIDPFGHAYARNAFACDLHAAYDAFSKEDLETKAATAKVAGRIMSKRGKGKVCFMDVVDKTGKIQAYLRKDVIGDEAYEVVKMADIGDIIGLEGTVMKTDSGELTLRVNVYTHLSKALRPLPEKFHGLQDKEEARRKRYLDLIVNDDAKKVAFLRPKIIRTVQSFLDGRGFVEVETPILQPILGGAAARPFITHHNALDQDFYLRIATELELKRLIVGGMEAVYEIGRIFRNEGMDATHNPEFTTVEAYLAYSDLDGMMELCESLFMAIADAVKGTRVFSYLGTELDFSHPFKRISMADAVKEKTGIDFKAITDPEEAVALAQSHKIPLLPHEHTVGHVLNKFFDEYVEETLVQPTFIYDHPLEVSPLAKKAQDPRYTQRFELYVARHEYANAFTELNDPIDQRERFLSQLSERENGNDEANEMDDDYVEAMEYGLAPTGGIGIGIDRTVMLFTDTDSIRDVLLFPTMKRR